MEKYNMSDLEEIISNILLKNGSFYRNSPDDKVNYFIDVATLGALAYEVIQFAANVFGASLPLIAGARWLYKKYFPKETIPTPNPSDQLGKQGDKSIQPADLKMKLDQLKLNTKDINILTQLTEDIAKILEYHGWPSAEASIDADHIVTTLTNERNA